MKLICIDASVALAFALQDDPKHPQAVAWVAALDAQGGALCAPALFVYECDSVLRLRMWKGDLDAQKVTEARALIEALGVEIEFEVADRARARQIAHDYNQPRAYDAAYAAHAQARGLDLITSDAPFFEAVNGSKRPKTAPALKWVKLLVYSGSRMK